MLDPLVIEGLGSQPTGYHHRSQLQAIRWIVGIQYMRPKRGGNRHARTEASEGNVHMPVPDAGRVVLKVRLEPLSQ